MRVLLTWELGLNLGHLTRLLPIAQQLKADGHVVLVAVRDIRAAATVLGSASIPFVQAPHLPDGIPLTHRATGCADILSSQGWSDRSALWVLRRGWLNIFQLFKPDKLILDYSPTVSLAARIAKIPTILIGNGFELPPLTDPLPPFPRFSWAMPERAAQSEQLAVNTASQVLKTYGIQPISALRHIMVKHVRLFATFPELDHHGTRTDVQYIGPLLGNNRTPRLVWPDAEGPKIFACLRPNTRHVNEILRALTSMRARVACIAGGFTAPQLVPFRKPHIRYSLGAVELEPLLDANLCSTYGAEGTIMKSPPSRRASAGLNVACRAFYGGKRDQTCGIGLRMRSSIVACGIAALLVFARFAFASEPAADNRFVLERTDAHPVCSAFLRLLNSTHFERPPSCGIPFEASVSGFSVLQKALIPEEGAERLFPHVFGFVVFQDQSTVAATWPSSVIRKGYGSNIFAWKYPSISLGNDGTKQDVLVWQGQGVDQFSGDATCGGNTMVLTRNYTYSAKQYGFILAPDGQSIDERRTKAIFGHMQGRISDVDRANHRLDFNEVGYAVGIFEFDTRYYIYAFYAGGVGDIYGKRKGDPSLKQTIAVLRRHENKTIEECEIRDREPNLQ